MLVKNLTFLTLLLAAFTFIFSACGDTEKVLEPEITLDALSTDDGDTLAPGNSVRLKGTYRKGADGKNLETLSLDLIVTRSTGSDGTISLWKLTEKNLESYNFDTTITLGPVTETETRLYRFTAIDKDKNTSTREVKVIVKKPGTVVTTPAKSFANLSFSNTTAYFATSGAATSPVDKATADGVASTIDLVYYFRSTDGKHSFIQPGVLKAAPYVGTPAEWANGTVATDFKTTTATEAEFTAAKADVSKIAPIYAAGTASVYVGNNDGVRIGGDDFAVGKVFAFNGKDGKKGLILVKSVLASGSATVDLIVQN